MEYKRLDSYELRSLCVKEQWFTCGDNTKYNKMFEMNDALPRLITDTAVLDDLALIISFCSDGVTREEVKAKLIDKMTPEMQITLRVDEFDMVYEAICRLNCDIQWEAVDYSDEQIQAAQEAERKLFEYTV